MLACMHAVAEQPHSEATMLTRHMPMRSSVSIPFTAGVWYWASGWLVICLLTGLPDCGAAAYRNACISSGKGGKSTSSDAIAAAQTHAHGIHDLPSHSTARRMAASTSGWIELGMVLAWLAAPEARLCANAGLPSVRRLYDMGSFRHRDRAHAHKLAELRYNAAHMPPGCIRPARPREARVRMAERVSLASLFMLVISKSARRAKWSSE